LRKYLIAAIAAFAAIAFAAGAVAQGPGASLDVKVSPKKSGSKKSPKNATIDLEVVNDDFSQTASTIEIWLPQKLKISTKGFKACDLDALAFSATACGSSSRVGGGEAVARAGVSRAGVYEANPPQLPFKVTAYVANPRSSQPALKGADLAFYLQQTTAPGGDVITSGITAIAPAFLSGAGGKYGSKLTVEIPKEPAQEYPAGQFNGLERLEAKLTKKSGKRKLITTTGCKKRKHPFKVAVSFEPNPAPPKQEKITAKDNAPCR
jgi:hypothetical protein